MSNPLISVMIPTCNREKYIQEAIDSVLAQDYRPLEVIVVDDGSTDRTADIVKQYDPGIVKYYYQKNAGIAAARNACVARSSGEFLAWLDSDDRYLPGKLTAQMQYLSENPQCDIVFTLYENFFDNEQFKNQHGQVKANDIFPSNSNSFHVTMLAYRAMVLRVGGRDISLKAYEDLTWISRIYHIYNIDISHCLNKIYYHRRIHENCISYRKLLQDSQSIESLSLSNRIRAGYLRKRIASATEAFCHRVGDC